MDVNKTPSKAVVVVMFDKFRFWGLNEQQVFLHLKMDGWNASLSSLLLGWPIFRGELFVLAEIEPNHVLFLGRR